MKKIFFKSLCIITATITLMLSSCAPSTPVVDACDTSSPNGDETLSTKRATKFEKAVRMGDDMYLHCGTSTQYDGGKNNLLVISDYGAEVFEVYPACFDPACIHNAVLYRSCTADCVCYRFTPDLAGFIKNVEENWYRRNFKTFALTGDAQEPWALMFTEYSLYLSKPFENQKIKLVDGKDLQPLNISFPLLYDGFVYYYQTYESHSTQWRIPISGGEPERVFEKDNVVIYDIIDDLCYIEVRDESLGVVGSRMRSDLAMTQTEALPDYWKNNLPFYFEGEYGYLAVHGDVYKFNNLDLSQEPQLVFSARQAIGSKKNIIPSLFCNGTVMYYVYYCDAKKVSYTNVSGFAREYQEYDTIVYGSYDVVTGETVMLDIKTERLLAVEEFLYADGNYLYLKVRDKKAVETAMTSDANVNIDGKLCRITIDGMKYEFIE